MPEYDSLIKSHESKQRHNVSTNGINIEEQIQLSKHEWNITSLNFSSNGLYLASGSWDKTVGIWDLRTLDEPKLLTGHGKGHTSAVTCVEWLPQIEFLLASGSADKSVLIWNSDSGDIMGRLQQHQSWVLGVAFTQSGEKMASSSWDGNVYIWDMNTLKPVNQLLGHRAGVWSCAFERTDTSSPVLCTASEDTSLRLWDLRADGRWYSDIILSGLHTDAIKCCTWSQCGNYLAAGSRDTKISIWDIRANKAINCLIGHTSEVCSISFLPSSSNLLLSVGDTRCCLWNTFEAKGNQLGYVQQHAWTYEVEALAITPDSSLLATGSVDKTIVLSTIEVTEAFHTKKPINIEELPYAKLPVKTQSASNIAQLGKSSADVVDHAKSTHENRTKDKEQEIAKQTIRIKAPVQSDFLKKQLSKLKSTDTDKKTDDNDSTEGKFLASFMKPRSETSTVPADESSIRYKSKELIHGRRNLQPTLLHMKEEMRRERTAEQVEENQDQDSDTGSDAESRYSSMSVDMRKVANEMVQLTEEHATYF